MPRASLHGAALCASELRGWASAVAPPGCAAAALARSALCGALVRVVAGVLLQGDLAVAGALESHRLHFVHRTQELLAVRGGRVELDHPGVLQRLRAAARQGVESVGMNKRRCARRVCVDKTHSLKNHASTLPTAGSDSATPTLRLVLLEAR